MAVIGLLVWAAAGSSPDIEVPAFAHAFDDWPLGGVLHAATAPLAQWDATWYLQIAADGYSGFGPGFDPERLQRFFPLYPMAIRAGAGFSREESLIILSGFAVSLAAFTGALYLLHKLVELELGRRHAAPTLLLLALFPTAFFFGIPYNESVFLLLSVGVFYSARLGHWTWAGALAGAASATRPQGLMLVLPLLILYLYGPRQDRAPDQPRRGPLGLLPRYRTRPTLLWIGLAPVGLLAFAAYLAATAGDPLAFTTSQRGYLGHELAWPWTTVWDGAVAGLGDTGQLVDRLRGQTIVKTEPTWWMDSVNLAALVFALAGIVAVFRVLPSAYGAYVAASLGIPLCTPISYSPLASLSRYVVVLFPLFIWLAVACRDPRLTAVLATLSGCLSVVLAWKFAAGLSFVA